MKNWLLTKLITKLVQDTLQKKGKWSRTSLTMFSAFWLGSVYAFISLYFYGYDFLVFVTYMSVATGLKIIDVVDKKMPEKNNNNEEETKE